MLFQLSSTAIVKNEGRYLAEWIEYHRHIGVEHFFIFDNGSTDQTREILGKYQKYGLVTHIMWPHFPGQISAYTFAMKAFGHMTEWMTVTDPDEFFEVRDGGSLTDFLAGFPDADQILVPFVFFGSSGHRDRPKGLVIDNYVHSEGRPQHPVKSIVRPAAVRYADVHGSVTTSRRTVTEDGTTVPERWQIAKPSQQKIRLNHYYIRSFQDFSEKIHRGQVDGFAGKSLAQFEAFDFKIPDASMRCHTTAIERRLLEFDNLPDSPRAYGRLSSLSGIVYDRPWTSSAQQVVKPLAMEAGDRTLYLDQNLDRCWAAVAPGEPKGVPDTAERWALARLELANRMEAEVVCSPTPDSALPGPVEAVPDERGVWRLAMSMEPGNAGRIYLSFHIALTPDVVLRIDVNGLDPAGRKYSRHQFLQLRPGSNFGFLSPCDMALSAGKVVIHLHGLAEPALVTDLSIWRFY